MTERLDAAHTPVIVGIGEILDRPDDALTGLEPLALMAAALRRAEADAGASLLARLDSLDLVNQVTWPYADMPAQLADLIGAAPSRAVYGPVGGESPIRFLHDAARRIARGESQIVAVCGAEAQSTLDKARRAKAVLPWTPQPAQYDPPMRGADFVHAAALNLGAFMPVTIYPFYENATLAQWGQTPAQAQAESGALGAAFSRVAAANPFAWLGKPHRAVEITTPSATNRLIAWPYTKLMVANPSVNQGGAVILTSLAVAQAAGIPPEKYVFVWGGAAASEPRDYLQRDVYYASPAQDAVLRKAMAVAGPGGFDALELYSCFPCVPKMAGRTLALPEGMVPTVAGGLTFFGAPLNTYMTHAACAMVRRLRGGARLGLLYGQGGFVTKHHGLVLSRQAPAAPLSQDTSVQAEADRQRGAVPDFVTEASGKGSVESFTVLYGRGGEAEHGVVMLRTEGNARGLARVPAHDAATLAYLENMDRTPVGTSGDIVTADDGVLEWRAG